jgi:two-component system, NtrC family, sensor kinase
MKSPAQCFFILLILLHCTLLMNAQNSTIDSFKKVLLNAKEDTNKVNTLNEISDELKYNSDFENAVQYAKKALQIAKNINFKRGEASAYRRIGANFFFQNSFPDALKNSYSALTLYEEIEDNRGIGFSLAQIGQIEYTLNNYQEALKNYLASLEVLQEAGDEKMIAVLYTSIADIYLNENNFTEALKADSLSLRISEKLQDSIGMALSSSSIGKIFEKEATIASIAGDHVEAKHKLLKALTNYIKAIRLEENGGFKGNIIYNYANAGNISIKLNNLSAAKRYLEKSLKVSKEVGIADNFLISYRGLSQLDSAEGNYKQAYEHYKMYILYRDSTTNEESIKKSLATRMQFEFEKKEVVAKATQDKKDAETKRFKNQQYFTIAVLAIIVLAVIVIAVIQFRSKTNKQKANSLLQRQKQKVESTLAELKSTQVQLIQSEKMASLGELTAGIAHEIQNPLNFVNNFSETNVELIEEAEAELKSGNLSEVVSILSDIKENEGKINHHGKRADAIVKGMLQHSRINAGQKEATDVNKLADEYLRLSYHGLRAKDKTFNADFKTMFDESIGKVEVLPQDIGRVLLNLFNNAFYAVQEKSKTLGEDYEPTVSVTTKKLDHKIAILVQDNGMGISKSLVDKIFQPFFTTKPTGQGTGLGLSLSYDIIKAHGGELKVESEEGEGAAFTIQLPLS